jgi:heme o synthase
MAYSLKTMPKIMPKKIAEKLSHNENGISSPSLSPLFWGERGRGEGGNSRSKIEYLLNLPPYITAIPQLCKTKISASVMVTAAAGIIFQRGYLMTSDIPTLSSILLLSCGACALNQVQDWRLDALMRRTQNRPIPSGKIPLQIATALSIALIALGTIILSAKSGIIPAAMGLIAIAWYNLLYTPLKRKTIWAFIPGAIIGAIPPYIGWWTAGGRYLDLRFALFLIFAIAWQLPHFWNLLMAYQNDYQKASLPIPHDSLTGQQISAINIALATFAAGAATLPFIYSSSASLLLKALACVLSLGWLYWINIAMAPQSRQIKPLVPFHLVNALGIIAMISLITQRLTH